MEGQFRTKMKTTHFCVEKHRRSNIADWTILALIRGIRRQDRLKQKNRNLSIGTRSTSVNQSSRSLFSVHFSSKDIRGQLVVRFVKNQIALFLTSLEAIKQKSPNINPKTMPNKGPTSSINRRG